MSGRVPIRKCIGCGQRDAKHNLLRIVLVSDEIKIELDETKCRPGRGAYLHPDAGCIEQGLVARRLVRAFRGPFEVYSGLAEAVMKATRWVAM